MRIAVAGPLPPSTSGIADYTVALAAPLAARAEVTLYYEGREAPKLPPAGLACRPLAELAGAQREGRHDLVLYQLGNSAGHHEATYRLLLELPGVVLLHEYMLHHLVRELTLVRGDAAAYLEEMRYAAGRSGLAAARRLLDTHYPIDTWSFPLFERVVDRSLGVAVHSEFARRRVLASRPLARVRTVPFPVDVEAARPADEGERARVRSALGIADGDLLIASFGFVTPQKHLEPPLAAFARLRGEQPRARLALVGEVSPHYDFDEVLGRLGRAGVTVTGRVSAPELRQWMLAADVAVNLRHPTGGETSATLMSLLALGRPCLVTDAGSFAELPGGAVAKVAAGPEEEEHLLALFRRLAADPELAAALGRAGRRHVEREHALGASAEALVAFAREIAAAPPAIEPAVPPLAPGPPGDPWLGLVAGLGRDLADLGIGEGDPELLGEIASRLVELDLDAS